MIKEAIEKILSLAAIEKIQYGERRYTSAKLIPLPEPAAPVLELNTLTGLVAYLSSGFDAENVGVIRQPERDTPRVALHIVSPTLVQAFQPVEGVWKNRHVVAQAKWNRETFPFGRWCSQEDFIIKMQATFQPSVSWQPVMDIAGRIVCEDKAELHDDGVAQAVTVSRGIRKESGIILPNPVILKPVRTFTEVAQPESNFIFRMKADPICLSLHEADMGAWELTAKENIRQYLEAELPGVPVFM